MKKLFSVILVFAIVLSLCIVSISAESSEQLTVTQTYSVKAGDVIQYTVYLNINSNNKICSLDAATFYSDNLQLAPEYDKYGDLDLDKMFPILGINTVNNLTGVPGKLIYNYSSALGGVRFNEDGSVLATFRFIATADGTATVSTKTKCLAMMDSKTNMVIIVDQDEGLILKDNFTFSDTITKTGTAKMYGDVNGDGKVNVSGDAVSIQRYAAGQTLKNFDDTVADINSDSKINVSGDAVYIQRYAAGQTLPSNILIGQYIIP